MSSISAVTGLSGSFLAHAAVRAVLQNAFRGALQAMEAAGFESRAIDGLVELGDRAGVWALQRHAVMRDPCTNNFVQICTGLNLETPPDRPAYARMRLQLHELDLPVAEYGEPKSVLVDLPLYEVLLSEPAHDVPAEQALDVLVASFTQGEDPSRWAGDETQTRFKEAFEQALQP